MCTHASTHFLLSVWLEKGYIDLHQVEVWLSGQSYTCPSLLHVRPPESQWHFSMVFHIRNYQFLSISEAKLTSTIILFLHSRAQCCFLGDETYWCHEAESRTLHGAAVLLLCSSSCQGITLYLYLQQNIDMKLYLDIYMKTFLLVLKLTVWIVFYYYKKLSLADKVFTRSLTVCINSSGNTGSSYTEGIAKP